MRVSGQIGFVSISSFVSKVFDFRRIIAGSLTLVLLGSCHGSSSSTERANPTGSSLVDAPALVVDLRKIGWEPPQFESNRQFFKDVGIAKLESQDKKTRIFFLGEDVIVAYHTKQEGKDWRTAPRLLEAFFIRATDGSLLSTKTWPASIRKSGNDLRDSESRLLPVYDGNFLVFANGAMSLYAVDLELRKQRKLEPDTQTALWGSQSITDGREVFLRHESTSERGVTYYWLSANDLEVNYQVPGYRDTDFQVQGLVRAGEKSVSLCPRRAFA
jgi:hypothetical protein